MPSEASRIRPLVWKLFLDLHRSHLRPPPFSAETFYDLATREASIMHRKIKNDTFRTLATDKAFGARVSEERLVMCLEAFVWRQQRTWIATRLSDADVPQSLLRPCPTSSASLRWIQRRRMCRG